MLEMLKRLFGIHSPSKEHFSTGKVHETNAESPSGIKDDTEAVAELRTNITQNPVTLYADNTIACVIDGALMSMAVTANDIYLAIVEGRVLRSRDGVQWTPAPMPEIEGKTWIFIGWNGECFIAVSNADNGNFVATSKDTQLWYTHRWMPGSIVEWPREKEAQAFADILDEHGWSCIVSRRRDGGHFAKGWQVTCGRTIETDNRT